MKLRTIWFLKGEEEVYKDEVVDVKDEVVDVKDEVEDVRVAGSP